MSRADDCSRSEWLAWLTTDLSNPKERVYYYAEIVTLQREAVERGDWKAARFLLVERARLEGLGIGGAP